MARAPQLSLALKARNTHGGKRRGAGRRRVLPGRPRVSHYGRPAISDRHPVHVTLRFEDAVWNLRSRRAFRLIEAALLGILRRADFRVVHFAVLSRHAHLVVEADSASALARGVQAFSVRVARGLNRLMARAGQVFSDRYHAHVLRTPAEVRRALGYVLLNFRSHTARLGGRLGLPSHDPYSSAAAFDGWRDAPASTAEARGVARLVQRARSWLLAVGWRRHGLLSMAEVPAR